MNGSLLESDGVGSGGFVLHEYDWSCTDAFMESVNIKVE